MCCNEHIYNPTMLKVHLVKKCFFHKLPCNSCSLLGSAPQYGTLWNIDSFWTFQTNHRFSCRIHPLTNHRTSMHGCRCRLVNNLTSGIKHYHTASIIDAGSYKFIHKCGCSNKIVAGLWHGWLAIPVHRHSQDKYISSISIRRSIQYHNEKNKRIMTHEYRLCIALQFLPIVPLDEK